MKTGQKNWAQKSINVLGRKSEMKHGEGKCLCVGGGGWGGQ